MGATDDLDVLELTAPTSGAVSVLSLTGAGAARALTRLGVDPPAPGHLRLARLSARAGAERELLDEGLVIGLDASHFEIHLHGSPAVVQSVRDELGGGRPRGDSLEQVAAQRLARAPSVIGARILLDQSEGALRAALERARLLEPVTAHRLLEELLERGRLAAAHLTPPRIVLAGPSNAGKSTLFNVLVGEQRVLVDRAPGTTRDAVMERGELDGFVVDFVDTAGERELPRTGTAIDADVEAEGQQLGRRARDAADLVLWLQPADGPGRQAPPESARLRVLDSRADRATGKALRRPISPLTDASGARAVVAALLTDYLGPAAWSPGQAVPFEPRHFELIGRAAGIGARQVRQELLGPLLAR